MDTKTTRKAKQKERILTILAISPRTVAMLAERMDVEKRWIRKLIDELGEDGRVYISHYEKVNSSVSACYTAGRGADAVKPVRVTPKVTAAKTEKAGKVRGEAFDPTKPVPCYRLWGLF